MKIFFTISLFSIFTFSLFGQFTNGNIVLVRVGAGTASLSNTGAAVFLDEYSPSGVLVQSIPLPSSLSGANRRLILSGIASGEGMIEISADKKYLTLAGYDADLGGSADLETTGAAQINRVVARIDKSGTVDVTTAFEDFADNGSPRDVISSNGVDFWMVGSTGGIRYGTYGSTTSLQLNNTFTTLNSVNISSGQLYAGTSFGQNVRIAKVGTNLPKNVNTSLVNLPGIPSAGSPMQFFFADLDLNIAGNDVLYIANESLGLQKFSLTETGWTLNGTIGGDDDDYRGLTGIYDAASKSVSLFAVRKGGTGINGGGELVKLTDAAGYNAPFTAEPTILATATQGKAFRGVALTPPQDPALPISILGFQVFKTSAGNTLSWQCCQETNISHFAMQKSTNGIDFVEFAKQPAVGSLHTNDYSVRDAQVAAGVVYYRIRTVEKTGVSSFSRILSISNDKKATFSVWPNPAVNSINVQYPMSRHGVASVTTLDGRRVSAFKMPANSSQTTVNIGQLNPGSYRLIYIDGGQVYQTLFTKMR